eukprot:757431-Hanusia_phi.AAC.1
MTSDEDASAAEHDRTESDAPFYNGVEVSCLFVDQDSGVERWCNGRILYTKASTREVKSSQEPTPPPFLTACLPCCHSPSPSSALTSCSLSSLSLSPCCWVPPDSVVQLRIHFQQVPDWEASNRIYWPSDDEVRKRGRQSAMVIDAGAGHQSERGARGWELPWQR